MISDQAERALALDPSQSFIVQAPAGSGKTELLTQRFLRLLACVSEPEEILAITFTKKAASEMRSRIRDALKKAQEQPKPNSAHEQQTWLLAKEALKQDQQRHWGLLANPNRLRIKTIDAFNSLLTRQLPLLSHFGAPPEIIDYPQMLYREAVRTFLTHLEEKLEWSEAIAQLLLHLDNNMKQAEDLLVDMLSKRDQWLPYIMTHQSHPSLRAMLEANLSAVVSDRLKDLKALFPKQLVPELITLLYYAATNLKETKPDSSILNGLTLSDLPGCAATDQPAWQGIAELLLTADETWRKRVDVKLGFPAAPKGKSSIEKEFKQRMEMLLEQLNEEEKLRAALAELFYLPNAGYTDKQWDILKALHEVLKIVVAQLSVIFKLYGKIDYTENAQAALLALGNEEAPTDLALVLDYQIKHLLVDEFQDTSNTQFRLLEKLVNSWQPEEGRSLFLVGDPMQSIYRFREAEVGLFIRARHQGIGPIQLRPLTLTVNFRSKPAIVEWINAHFNQVMPAFDDLSSGAVSYTASVAAPLSHDSQSQGSAVQLHAFVNAAAKTQADTIAALIQENPQDKIAILVRSRSHLAELIPALKRAKLPYQAVEIDALESRPLIQDLLALTRALLYPADRVAWLALLRAPWCGLSLNDLLLIAGNDSQELIWQRLQQAAVLRSLSTQGQQALQRILPLLTAMISERQREEIYLWVEKTWLHLGGPACADNEADLKDAKIFFALLKKISLNGNELNSGLSWEALEQALQKLYAQSKASSRIQIMTIHNAKGLEFDTVILPHLERGSGAKDKPLLTWLERPQLNQESALLLAPIHAVEDEADKTYTHIRQQDNNKTKHENGRLLYVAATRAKKSLHLLMSLKTKSQGELSSPTDGSLLKKLWPAIQDKVQYRSSALPNAAQPAPQRQLLKRLHSSWENPSPSLQPAERPRHNKVQGFHLRQSAAQALGLVVHRLLQALADKGIAWWQDKAKEQQDNYIRMLLLDKGLLDSLAEASLPKVRLAIQNTLQDPRGRWLIEQEQAASELALTAVIEQEPKMLIIDRTFIDKTQVRWLIDYKSSVPEPDQALNAFLAQEREKYSEPMHQYAAALKMMDPRPLRLGLYFPLVPAWCEWQND